MTRRSTQKVLSLKESVLRNFLRQYSADDLLKSFFALNLWLPNIACPIKIQYLYTFFEFIENDLSLENRILCYKDFRCFCEEVIKLLPSFAMLEDYVPENDWKDIKYFFKNRTYDIFYGGDLSNPYDFYYSFEIIHEPFNAQYIQLLQRSPLTEFRFCIELQNDILAKVKQRKRSKNNVSSGHIEIPAEYFWNSVIDFIQGYNVDENYSPDILNLYTKKDSDTPHLPSIESFTEKAFLGSNCCYFFIKKLNKYYPVMPRRWLTVIYDIWGNLLKENYRAIQEILDKKEPGILICIGLAKFILERIKENNIFPLVTSVQPDLRIANDLVFIAIHVENKIFLIHIAPPIFELSELNQYVDNIGHKLEETIKLIKHTPTRLRLLDQENIVEFRNAKTEQTLLPHLIIALPSALSSLHGSIKSPKNVTADLMTLDQIVGIFDEIDELKELDGFFEYIHKEQELKRGNPLNSYLDKFGAYKDSHGVLVAGAIEPDKLVLDFSWGSNFRFESLKKFWRSFPSANLFGHPRSWSIPDDRRTKTGLILNSKTFFGYAYYQKINNNSFFINAPVHKMRMEDGMINDSLMQALFDSIDIYPTVIKKLVFPRPSNRIHIFFCPSYLAKEDNDFKHIKYLVKDSGPWLMDCTLIHNGDYGIRVVYNKDYIINELNETKDRSVQINLLLGVIEQINVLVPQASLLEIKTELEREKTKKARFKTFALQKVASFPEGVRGALPTLKEFKLADKEISKAALSLNIKPGKYSSDEAKIKLNTLRSSLVKTLDAKIRKFNAHSSIPILIEGSNALAHSFWRTEEEIKASQTHEVDYEREERLSEKERFFIHWQRTYRYLTEKFVQLQPNGDTEFNESELQSLLAFSDRLIDLYTASDLISYELYPVNVVINRDYIVNTSNEKNDIESMDRDYGIEQSQLKLGLIGNNTDTVDSNIPVVDYLDELDQAFKKDFGFGLRNFINVQQVLSLWADNAGKKQETSYLSTLEEISLTCSKSIQGFSIDETKSILDFLTLKPEEMLFVKGKLDSKNNPEIQEDLPIWEHNKRLMRLDIRPLIMLDGKFCWGPHSMHRTSLIWMGITSKHRLPSDISAPNVEKTLLKGHLDLEKSLVKKIVEIVNRYADNVKPGVYPHRYDNGIRDIGDIDIFAYFQKENIILNIESKIIDPPRCHKDSARMQRKIFRSYSKENGGVSKCDLDKVLDRESYLIKKGKDLVNSLGWGEPSADPKVVSIFVTKIGFWWTRFPPISSSVNFVEIRLLDDFVKRIKQQAVTEGDPKISKPSPHSKLAKDSFYIAPMLHRLDS